MLQNDAITIMKRGLERGKEGGKKGINQDLFVAKGGQIASLTASCLP